MGRADIATTPSRLWPRRVRLLSVVILGIAGMPSCTRCGAPAAGPARTSPPEPGVVKPLEWYSMQRTMYHGIPVRIRFAPADATLATAVWDYLERVDDLFNFHRAESDLGRLNADPASGPVVVSPELAAALKQAIEAHRLTGGAFDATVGPLARLWKSAAKRGSPPPPPAVAQARARVGSDRLRLEGNRLTRATEGMQIDLGGIVKGIALDHVVNMLHQQDVAALLVQIGGETAAFGPSMRDGGPQIIAIEDPRTPSTTFAKIRDTGTGLCGSTSSNVHRFVDVGSRRYHHVLNPRTGEPVESQVLSMSAVFRGSGQCWLADALSTAGTVVGPERAVDLVAGLGGEALVLYVEDGTVREARSQGWAALVVEIP